MVRFNLTNPWPSSTVYSPSSPHHLYSCHSTLPSPPDLCRLDRRRLRLWLLRHISKFLNNSGKASGALCEQNSYFINALHDTLIKGKPQIIGSTLYFKINAVAREPYHGGGPLVFASNMIFHNITNRKSVNFITIGGMAVQWKCRFLTNQILDFWDFTTSAHVSASVHVFTYNT